jgi:type III pantothenate kinase
LVRRIKKEWTAPDPLVIATGGLAETLRPFCETFDLVDAFLTLQGVRIGYQLLSA